MERPSYKGENPFKDAVKQVIEIEKEDYIMEKNEIKKALYKQKPSARLVGYGDGAEAYAKGFSGSHIPAEDDEGAAYYETSLKLGEHSHRIFFEIPKDELKDVDGNHIFNKEEPAQLLIRWLVV